MKNNVLFKGKMCNTLGRQTVSDLIDQSVFQGGI